MENNNISEALKIYHYRDWSWEMADDNFGGRYNKAKAEMKDFVALVSAIESAEVRNALRRMWTLRYEELQASYMGNKFSAEEELKDLESRFAYAA